MTPTKRFLLVFLAVYVVVAVTLIVLLGPPDYSSAYMDEFRDAHQRYLEIIKSDEYKLHQERPHLHPAEGRFADDMEFVHEYESRERFQDEQRRMFAYNLLFDLLNAGAVVALAVRFGKQPLLGFLDDKIDDVRRRIRRSEEVRARAAKAKAQAEAKLKGIEDDKRRIEHQTAESLQQEKQAIAALTAENLDLIAVETEERKQREARQAAMQMKAEIVERSVSLLAERLRSELTESDQAVLLEQFVGRLEHVE